MTTRSALIPTALATVVAVLMLSGGPATADGTSENTVLKNASKPTYLANAMWRTTPSWVDKAPSGELVTYPAPDHTGPLIVGSTCIPRDQDPVNGGLVRTQDAGDGSTCMRFTAERTSSGTFTFRVAEPGMPADGRYLGDGDGGGFLDLISTTPRTQFVITEHPALTVTATVTAAELSRAATGPVQFVFDVTNAGNVDVHNLAIAASTFTGSDTPSDLVCDLATLGPGATTQCTSDYTVTADDEAQGAIDLTVVATALTPSDATVTSAATTATLVTREVAAPQLAATGFEGGRAIGLTALLVGFGLTALAVGRTRAERRVRS